MNRLRMIALLVLTGLVVAGLACAPSTSSAPKKPTPAPSAKAPTEAEDEDEVAENRAKLSPEDRALVEAQEWCVVSTDERLGSMGAPVKLDIDGKAVFVCCKGCKKKAESDPKATLAKLDELKAKAKKEKAKPE